RLPAPVESTEAPTPEASGFSLPELPVSVAIDTIAANRVAIGQPVFGVESLVSVDGGLRLEGGEGEANLALNKLDAPGAITLAASYSNTSEILALNLEIDEGENGIIAGLLDVPGRPSVSFSVSGEAPISEYAADIRLATDGSERLTGRITTAQPDGSEEGTLRVRADISGNVAPIFNAEYQPFFGDDVRIGAVITRFPDGRTNIDDMTLSAASLNLDGTIRIGADGLPDEIDVTGNVAAEDGAVLLPLPGPETRVDRANLEVKFDAAEGDLWTGAFEINGLNRPGFSAEQLSLTGSGQISGGATAAVSAELNIAARALDLGNPDAEEALGEIVTGRAEVDWTAGEPLRLGELVIDGESYNVSGDATVTFTEAGPSISGQADARAERLSVFSGLAGRTLGGRVDLSTSFVVAPLAGTFDVTATGTSDNLIVSQPQVDRILEGSAQLDVTAARDETGITFALNTLETPNASLTGAASLRSGGSTIQISGRLDDAAIIVPSVSGPIRLQANAEEDRDRVWDWQVETSLEGTSLSAMGSVTDLFGTPIIAASGRFEADDLSDFAALSGRPLAGGIATDFAGEVAADLSRASANLSGSATDVAIGVPEADDLLEGAVAFRIDAAMAGDVISLRDSSITGDHIELRADATIVPEAGRFDLEGRLTDASRILEGAPAEAFDFSAEGQQDGRDWQFDVDASGAGVQLSAEGIALDALGETASVEGKLRASAEDLAIFSDLANRPLTGRLAIDATGSVNRDLSRFDVSAAANGSGLSIGQTEADRLLSGDLTLVADASRDGGAIEIETLEFQTGMLEVAASGALASDESDIEIQARLADIGPFAPGFSGPASVTGSVGQNGDGRYTLDISGNGPGGTQVAANGTVAADLQTVSINVDGRAPLGLANSFIAPRALSGSAGFRLTIDGPPALSSVGGQITTSDARFIAPALGIVFNGIDLNASLSGAQAQVSMTAAVENGGVISAEGPVALSPPFSADL
ncbi:MAG: hypothetical protein HKP35_12315, partial [Silicimonas sp.]|nr:hypothetical protein [Silicimonas sp.]